MKIDFNEFTSGFVKAAAGIVPGLGLVSKYLNKGKSALRSGKALAMRNPGKAAGGAFVAGAAANSMTSSSKK